MRGILPARARRAFAAKGQPQRGSATCRGQGPGVKARGQGPGSRPGVKARGQGPGPRPGVKARGQGHAAPHARAYAGSRRIIADRAAPSHRANPCHLDGEVPSKTGPCARGPRLVGPTPQAGLALTDTDILSWALRGWRGAMAKLD